MTGIVYLIGAGPGDPELLSRKAYRLLKSADVVVYDRLISPDILDLIPEKATKIYAGKSCTEHAMKQDEINACLIKHAHQGHKVVRLKGGDPLLYSRGGEEIKALQQQNITVEVVAGISAASGCAASLGLPLTHRDFANNVCYITGHRQEEVLLQYDWKSLTDPMTTLVIYMGLNNLPFITKKLLEHGMEPTTPAVAIENGTTGSQRTLVASVLELAHKVEKQAFAPPVMVIIGRVVSLIEEDHTTALNE